MCLEERISLQLRNIQTKGILFKLIRYHDITDKEYWITDI